MKKLFKILGWSLFAILVVVVFVFLFQKSRKKPDRYAIEEVKLTDTIENKSVLTGRIEPRNEVLLKPQLSGIVAEIMHCLLYTSPSPRDRTRSRMPSSA